VSVTGVDWAHGLREPCQHPGGDGRQWGVVRMNFPLVTVSADVNAGHRDDVASLSSDVDSGSQGIPSRSDDAPWLAKEQMPPPPSRAHGSRYWYRPVVALEFGERFVATVPRVDVDNDDPALSPCSDGDIGVRVPLEPGLDRR